MTYVAELLTEIKANNRQFMNTMQQSKREAKSFADEVQNRLKKAFEYTAIVGTLYKIKQTFTDTRNELDDLNTSATKFGTSLNNMRFLQYFAQRSDLPLSKLESGLVRLRFALGNLEKTGDVFKKLGLDPQQLKNMDITDAYIKLGSALKNINDSTDRANLAKGIFGKSGQDQLLALLNNSEELRKTFDKLGGTISDLQQQSLNRLDEALDNSALAWQNYKQQVVANSSEVLITLNKLKTNVLTNLTSNDTVGPGEFFSKLLAPMDYDNKSFRRHRRPVPNILNTAGNIGAASSNAGIVSQFDRVAASAQTLASALDASRNTIKNSLKNFLGLDNKNEASDYLSSIIKNKPQAYDKNFTELVNQLRNNIGSGTKGFGLNNESILAQLRGIAELNGYNSDISNSGMLSVVKQLEKLMRGFDPRKVNDIAGNAGKQAADSVNKQQVEVQVKVDEQGMIKAFVNSRGAKDTIVNYVNEVAESAARAAR